MHLILAPDSLKGSLTAPEVCDAMEQGARRALNSTDLRFTHIPLADGGEGTLDCLVRAGKGDSHSCRVEGPLGQAITARWARLADGTAVIEMAQASGLTLVEAAHRDAKRASTYGTGQLMRAALDAGCQTLIVGIGGSATTDGGSGALRALGARFLDGDGNDLPPGGGALCDLERIDLTDLDPRLAQCRIEVLCDVTNPLCGEQGAAAIYGPQKGASPPDVTELDAALAHYADIAAATLGSDRRTEPGAGAAGGLGFGLMAFTGAQLVPGIGRVLELSGFADAVKSADLVLTAEGSIDQQTLSGKAIAGVARATRAARPDVPTLAFGGAVTLTGSQLDELGVAAAFPLPNRPLTLDECIENAGSLMTDATERALRLWAAARRNS